MKNWSFVSKFYDLDESELNLGSFLNYLLK